MDPHSIELPRKIMVGNSVLDRVPSVCEELKISGKPLVLTGEHTKGIAGERVRDSLLNVDPDTSMEIVREASKKEVDKLEKATGFDIVVSVGGGKVIDVGKLLAYQKKIPFVSIPTAPSHDGVASERVSLKDGGVFHSLRAKSPIAIIADIGILSNAPYKLIASGGADVISNHTAFRGGRS